MAAPKQKTSNSLTHRRKPKKRRPGVHSKKKSSRNKNSKNYKKLYVSQG